MCTIEDFEIQDGILTAYFGSDNNITIPDSVTEIGESAFGDSDIESVVIPNGVKVNETSEKIYIQRKSKVHYKPNLLLTSTLPQNFSPLTFSF